MEKKLNRLEKSEKKMQEQFISMMLDLDDLTDFSEHVDALEFIQAYMSVIKEQGRMLIELKDEIAKLRNEISR